MVKFIESLYPTESFKDGLHPGFTKISDKTMIIESSIENWLNSIIIYKDDLIEGKLIKDFFQRRELILNGKEIKMKDKLDKYYFDGRIFNIDQVGLALVTFLLEFCPLEQLFFINEVELSFIFLAHLLLNCCLISLNESEYSLAEIEFYYYSPDHLDPYPHKNSEQLKSKTWYFHKTGNSYREGTYKGLDISLGDNKNYGGILIRSLKNMKTGEVVCGPCCCVDELLKVVKIDNVGKFVENCVGNNIFDGKLRLKLNTTKCSIPILSSIRIGLNLNKRNVDYNLQVDFLFKNYRYFINNIKLKKGKTQAILQMIKEKKKIEEINDKYGKLKVKKILLNIEKGKTTNIKDYYDRKLTDIDLALAFGSLLK